MKFHKSIKNRLEKMCSIIIIISFNFNNCYLILHNKSTSFKMENKFLYTFDPFYNCILLELIFFKFIIIIYICSFNSNLTRLCLFTIFKREWLDTKHNFSNSQFLNLPNPVISWAANSRGIEIFILDINKYLGVRTNEWIF